MFKFRFILTALLIMFAANLSANAATIGYADFQKVISDYTFARNAYKDIDNKLLIKKGCNTMLNISGKSGHPFLVPGFSGKSFRF